LLPKPYFQLLQFIFLTWLFHLHFPVTVLLETEFCRDTVFCNMMLCSLLKIQTFLRNVSLHTTTQKTVFPKSLLSQPQIPLKFLDTLLYFTIISAVSLYHLWKALCWLVKHQINVTKIPQYFQPDYSSYSTVFFSTNLSRSLLSFPAMSYVKYCSLLPQQDHISVMSCPCDHSINMPFKLVPAQLDWLHNLVRAACSISLNKI
jgi:hypothetical protein